LLFGYERRREDGKDDEKGGGETENNKSSQKHLSNAHSPVLLPSVVPLFYSWLPATTRSASAIPCRTAAVAFCASVFLVCCVRQVWGLEGAVRSDGAHRALVAPGVLLVRVRVYSCDDGVDTAGGAGRSGWELFREFVGDGVAHCGRFGAVAVAFEDFFGGDLGVVGPESGVVEDECEVLGYLG
jgi:hypothetical protein